MVQGRLQAALKHSGKVGRRMQVQVQVGVAAEAQMQHLYWTGLPVH